MEGLGQQNISVDGKKVIENVLLQPGVVMDISIFSAAISAHPGFDLDIYEVPAFKKEEETSAW